MSERIASPPVDLTLERLNRVEQKLDALIDHQKSVATNLAASMRDLGNRVDSIEQGLSNNHRDMSEVRQSLREVRIDQIEHTNQILTAIQKGFQAHQRLGELEERLPPAPR